MSSVAIRSITGQKSEASLFEYVDASAVTRKQSARAMECTSSSSSSSALTGGGGEGEPSEMATKKSRGGGGISINISFDKASVAGDVSINTM